MNSRDRERGARTFQHLDRYSAGLLRGLLAHPISFCSDYLTKASLTKRLSQDQARKQNEYKISTQLRTCQDHQMQLKLEDVAFVVVTKRLHERKSSTYLSRGNSQMGSRGSSNSMTPASMGVQLDDRRATLMSEALDLPEELESREYCGGRTQESRCQCKNTLQLVSLFHDLSFFLPILHSCSSTYLSAEGELAEFLHRQDFEGLLVWTGLHAAQHHNHDRHDDGQRARGVDDDVGVLGLGHVNL